MAYLNVTAEKENTYDAIVIGSGISGGWAAKELCENGLKTLVLERGSKLEEQPPLDFYRRVKQFTLTGYFTSEEIGKNVLRFDPIPENYNSCLPYNGENIWTI